MTEQERYENMVDEIIDLKNEINRQKAKIKELSNNFNTQGNVCEKLLEENANLKAENERLNGYLDVIGYSTDKIKAEAYKEFAERVKNIDLYQYIEEYYENAELCYEVRQDWINEKINNLLKELVGEDK